MKKAAFLVMIFTILSKLLGFGREIVLSYVYGASGITDAYLISQTVPIAIFGFISTGITTAFIPMFSRIKSERGQDGAINYTNNLINILLLLASVIVVVVTVFAQPIVKLFASGFSGQTLALAVNFTRIAVFGVYFTALLNIFTGYLRLHQKYVIPTLASFPMNIIIIASLFISSTTNIYVLAAGTVLAAASQLLLMLPFIRKAGYKYEPILNLNDQYMKEMMVIAFPVVLGTSVAEVKVLINRTLASGIAVGGISALNYANRLNSFIQSLFVASIIAVLYPIISKLAAEKNIKGIKSYISEAILMVNLLVIPATIGAMIFSKEIVALLLGVELLPQKQ